MSSTTSALPQGPSPHPRHARGGDVRLRRLMALLLMSAVVPGSGHLAAGRPRAGRIILRVWLVLVVLVAALAVVAVLDPQLLVRRTAACALSTGCLETVRWGALGLGLAWTAVIVSAVLLGHPGSVNKLGRSFAVATAFVLCAAVVAPTVYVANAASETNAATEKVFSSFPQASGAAADDEPTASEVFGGDRVNVLLLGSDAGDAETGLDPSGVRRTGLRSDTMIVASINTETGRTILYSLPRNLERVPFSAGSPMAEAYPKGYFCKDQSCLLNAIYTEFSSEKYADQFPGDPDPGLTALRDGISTTLGLDIPYFMIVDLGGFEQIIDALGGVHITVDRRLPIGGLDAHSNHVKPSGYIEAGPQLMSGATALAFARSRSDSTDYERIQRQSCLIGAIAKEADPLTLVKNYGSVVDATTDALRTNVDRDAAKAFVQLALKIKDQPIERLPFIPPTVPDTSNPDFDEIRALVQSSIVASDAAGDAPAPAATTATPAPSAAPTTSGSTEEAAPAATPTEAPSGEAQDLSAVCQY